MALPIRPNSPNNPIPNNPFYAPLNPFVNGPYFPVDLGAGINMTSGAAIPSLVNNVAAVIFPGTGISVSTVGTNTTIANTGVTELVAGSNITLSSTSGVVTISAAGGGGGGGSVTSVGTGVGLTGGPITSSGIISLMTSGVAAGSYTNPNIVVDAYGRITLAANGTTPLTGLTGTVPVVIAGSAPTLNVSVNAASTTAPGVVQLNNTTSSTSTTLALTAAQGKALQDQITALLTTPGIEFAGTLNASTGLVDSVTSVGTGAGYTNGSTLPVASATTVNTYVIVTTPGTIIPPGGSSTVTTDGDWLLVAETSPGTYVWQFLNVGFDAPSASTSVAGIVCLSTNALAQAGADTTTALTPAAAASAYIPKTCVTAKGTLITGTAACTPVGLAVGTDGQFLVANSASPNGLCWTTVSAGPATPTVFGTVKGCTETANTALGCNALGSGNAATGCGHIAIGLCALYTTGATSYNNIAIGSCSAALTSTGNSNVSIGFCSLALNTTGSQNVAIGVQALSKNTTSGTNTAVGANALACYTGTSVSTNDAFGANALFQFTSGDYNVSLGGWSLYSAICGCLNTAVGHRALTGVTCANLNTALGFYAGQNITTGCNNVTIGTCTFVPNPTGNCQLVIGWSPTCNWLTGCSDKSIQPSGGIRDCAGSLGTAGQVLSSTGTAVQWATGSTGVPGWTSAGTVQAVGISAVYSNGTTGVSPTITTTLYNNIRYRQLGLKEWEVQGVLKLNAGGATAGAGYYLLTLPAGLQFDISSPYQLPYTGVPDDGQQWMFYGLTNSYARASQNGATSYQQSSIVPYTATKYRIMFVGPGTTYWADGYYQLGGTNQGFKWGFTFQTP